MTPLYFVTEWYDHGTFRVNKQKLSLTLYLLWDIKSFFDGKISYLPPILTDIEGDGATNGKTEGGVKFQMKGKNLLKLANIELPIFLDEFFKNTGYQIQNVDKIIPHQASKLGLLLFKKMYSLSNEAVIETLYKYGNCIAASIPLTFIDAIEDQRIKRGDICLLSGTSAGFSIGSLLIKYWINDNKINYRIVLYESKKYEISIFKKIFNGLNNGSFFHISLCGQ